MGKNCPKDKFCLLKKIFRIHQISKKTLNGSSGFSLVELMAVVVIIGALVAIAIPIFSNSSDEASNVVCETNQYHLRVAEEAYNLMYGVHTDEYINGWQLSENSPIHKFFVGGESLLCPVSGEHYSWARRDGGIMLFCPTHGTDNPPIIAAPPPVSVSTLIYAELMQDYPDSKIKNMNYSENIYRGTNGGEAIIGSGQRDVVQGRNGNDLIDGGEGDDNLKGNKGNDGIFGGSGNDYINGGAGNDVLHGGAGDDTIVGGNGMDKVVYDKPRSSYIITKVSRTKFIIEDSETGEKDTVNKVENIQFGEDDIITVKELLEKL